MNIRTLIFLCIFAATGVMISGFTMNFTIPTSNPASVRVVASTGTGTGTDSGTATAPLETLELALYGAQYDGSGVWYDASGGGHNASSTGVSTPGKSGNNVLMSYGATQDGLVVSGGESIGKSLEITVVVRCVASSTHPSAFPIIVAKGVNNCWLNLINAANLAWRINGADTTYAPTFTTDHTYVTTYSKSNQRTRIYIDGEQVATGSVNQNYSDPNAATTIGNTSALTNGFRGAIRGVLIYKSELSSGTISTSSAWIP